MLPEVLYVDFSDAAFVINLYCTRAQSSIHTTQVYFLSEVCSRQQGVRVSACRVQKY